MTIIANLALVAAALLYFGLLSALTSDGPKGGDAVVSHAWGMIYLHIAFWLCMNVAAGAAMWKGAFLWITTVRGLVVFGGLFALCLTIAVCALFRDEPNAGLWRPLGNFVPFVFPPILLILGFITANDSLKEIVPLPYYQLSMKVICWCGLAGVGLMVMTWITESIKSEKIRADAQVAREDETQKSFLHEIDTCDVNKNICNILGFTDRYQDDIVKQRALAKIRSNPDWEQEVIQLFETVSSEAVFRFLASNPVEHKEIFYKPLHEGILFQASLIRDQIRRSSHPSHFYPELFLSQVQRVIWTVDNFKDGGVSYMPEMKALRAALDEPSDVKKVNLSCVSVLDEWIRKNQ